MPSLKPHRGLCHVVLIPSFQTECNVSELQRGFEDLTDPDLVSVAVPLHQTRLNHFDLHPIIDDGQSAATPMSKSSLSRLSHARPRTLEIIPCFLIARVRTRIVSPRIAHSEMWAEHEWIRSGGRILPILNVVTRTSLKSLRSPSHH